MFFYDDLKKKKHKTSDDLFVLVFMVFRFETEDWWLRGSVCVCVLFCCRRGKWRKRRTGQRSKRLFFVR